MVNNIVDRRICNEYLIQVKYIKNFDSDYYNYVSNRDRIYEFLEKRNDVVKKSIISNLKEVRNYQYYLEKYPDRVSNGVIYLDDCVMLNPSVDDYINDSLESDGFDINNEGVIYLAKLICILYHERKLYYDCCDDPFNYWNLDNFSNIHYEMLGGNRNKVIHSIISSFVKNDLTGDLAISDYVYSFVDNMGYYSADKKNSKRKRYSKMYN